MAQSLVTQVANPDDSSGVELGTQGTAWDCSQTLYHSTQPQTTQTTTPCLAAPKKTHSIVPEAAACVAVSGWVCLLWTVCVLLLWFILRHTRIGAQNPHFSRLRAANPPSRLALHCLLCLLLFFCSCFFFSSLWPEVSIRGLSLMCPLVFRLPLSLLLLQTSLSTHITITSSGWAVG